MEEKIKIDEKIEELKSFLNQCKRVLMVLRKPTREEYLNVAKVTGLGICFLGVLGYIIHVPIVYLKGIVKGVK
ncbi:protein translocase SEC61 complex subunit gamma [Methanofervidicoccus sp. A16]|uniref:protein translocase SEC61 complex subunit gamma n=1 Tax=Methanofervidicoccus sp. A16 TaxID=2607662 RepID=UPI00118C78FD|nr:protein translocase SEC61 complex subunit gamma [Methanofervidicoccus sp. A16]AXI25400.1 protein translocase SEC61 complex subunit gamma [Methanofervidicoccus sp. A16]